MLDPIVTVIMPVYNAGQYLRNAVLSVISQSFQKFELIIIDDGSTDDALLSISDIQDTRIRMVHNIRNIGLAATLNVGIGLARGKFIARMDQDDISYPERFARQVETLEGNPNLDLVGTRCVTIDENNQIVGALPFAQSHRELCSAPWRGFYLPHPTWMGRIEWFRRNGYANPAPYLCEDQEILLRTYLTSNFFTLPEVLFAYRIRTKIDLDKLRKTRRSVLLMQLDNFKINKRWRYCILSFLTYITRLFIDVTNRMFQALSQAGLRHDIVSLGDAERTRFRAVIDKLEAEGYPRYFTESGVLVE